MRLTLRTLLAYSERQLHGGDAGPLAAKIEASPFAQRVLLHIKQLGAAAGHTADSRESVEPWDANRVAAYLDNSLSDDELVEFERACLTNDALLGEVAATHQVLSQILDRPVHLEWPELQRIRAAVAVERPPLVEPVSDLAPQPPPVPCDDADSHSDRLLRAALLVGTLTVTLGIFVSLVPTLKFREPAPETPSVAPDPAPDPDPRAEGAVAIAARPNATSTTTAKREDVDVPQSVGGGAQPSGVGTQPAGGGTQPSVDVVVAKETTESGEKEAVVEAEAISPRPVRSLPFARPTPAASTGPPEVRRGRKLLAESAAVIEEAVGQVMSEPEEELVARLDRTNLRWTRLPRRAELSSGDWLLTLPGYRATIRLGGAGVVTLCGPALVRLLPEHRGDSRILVRYGRLIVKPARRQRLRLQCGDFRGALSVRIASAHAAVEVRRWRRPGAEEMFAKSRDLVELFAIHGPVQLRRAGSESPLQLGGSEPDELLLMSGDRRLFVNGLEQSMDRVKPPPAWALGDPRDEATREVLAALLPPGDFTTPLDEMLHRFEARSDLAGVAANTGLIHLGLPDTAIAAFDNEAHAEGWADYLSALRMIIDHDDDQAAVIQQASLAANGDRSARVHRLIQGFNPGQLDEQAGPLVDDLTSSELALRVLAFENLRRITGKTMLYHPAASARVRAARVENWRAAQRKKEIVFRDWPF